MGFSGALGGIPLGSGITPATPAKVPRGVSWWMTFSRQDLPILTEVRLLVEAGRVPLADAAGQRLAFDLDALVGDFPEEGDLGFGAVLLGLLRAKVHYTVADRAVRSGGNRIALGAGRTGSDDDTHGITVFWFTCCPVWAEILVGRCCSYTPSRLVIG